MGLLAHYRRWWIVAFVTLLGLPMIGEAVTPTISRSDAEARNLAKAPAMPGAWHEWTALPRAIDRYLADHFGFRDTLIHGNALVRYALSSPANPLVTYGRDSYLFYVGNNALEQSMGVIVHEDRLRMLADIAAELHQLLAKQNIAFLFTASPNASTINREHLPGWAGGVRGPTEYDLVLRMLADRRVPALDLRPALRSENARRAVYYRTGAHWNMLGAAIARNEIVRAIGRPEWAVDIDQAFRGYRKTTGNELARFLGVASDIEDVEASIDMSRYPPADGPTVLMIGDSFIYDYFPRVWANGGRLEIVASFPCMFDPGTIARFNPAIVILAPTESFLPCVGGIRQDTARAP